MTKKRIISLLTAAAVCAGMSVPAFADEITEVPDVQITAEKMESDAECEDSADEAVCEDRAEPEDSVHEDTDVSVSEVTDAQDDDESISDGLVEDDAEYYASGRFGDNNSLTWSYNSSTGKLTITGTGAMPDSVCPWSDFKTSIREISIGNGVTAVGDYAFDGFSNVYSVYMPASVDDIGELAFAGCENLTSVNIPDADVDYAAFSGCKSLKTLTFTKGTADRTISSFAFSHCESLESLNLPENITKLGIYSFSACTSLRSAVIPGSLQTVSQKAFYYCTSLERVVMNEGVEIIDKEAFDECYKLTGVRIPSSVKNIGEAAFFKCKALHTVSLPDADIGKGAFRGCESLVNVVIAGGNTGRTIGEYAFCECRRLTAITIPDNFTALGANCFALCESLREIVIPESIREIPSYAFWDCTSLVSVRLPYDLDSICDHAFSQCTALRTVTIPNADIRYGAFSDCTRLSNVTIKNGTNKRKIGSYAFKGCDLTYITLPDSITEIGYNAFQNNGNLKRAVLPAGLVTIETELFYNCRSLAAVNIPESVAAINDRAFYNCPLRHIHIASGKTAANYSGRGSLPTDRACYFFGGKEGCSTSCPLGTIKVPAVAFDVKGVFGGREVTFRANGNTDKSIQIYYTTENRSALRLTDRCVTNGDTVLFENYYGTIYARAYIDGTWGNVSRLILKIPVVNKPTITRSKDKVTIKTTTPDSYIIYTTDGSKPTLSNGTRVKSPAAITVKKGQKIRAIAVRSCFTNSEEASLSITGVS